MYGPKCYNYRRGYRFLPPQVEPRGHPFFFIVVLRSSIRRSAVVAVKVSFFSVSSCVTLWRVRKKFADVPCHRWIRSYVTRVVSPVSWPSRISRWSSWESVISKFTINSPSSSNVIGHCRRPFHRVVTSLASNISKFAIVTDITPTASVISTQLCVHIDFVYFVLLLLFELIIVLLCTFFLYIIISFAPR